MYLAEDEGGREYACKESRELKLLLHAAAVALHVGGPLSLSVLLNGQHEGSTGVCALREGEPERDRCLLGKGQPVVVDVRFRMEDARAR